MSPATRLSADERRRMVLRAALVEFARGGFDGTSTETIAQRAGISQPYLFRLFPNKKALFVASVHLSFQMVVDAFEEASDGLAGPDALVAMAKTYNKLITDRDLLMHQMQAYASCDDADVRDATRDGFGRLWQLVQRVSGVDDDAVRNFFAYGMLANVIAAMNLTDYDAPWAQMCLPDDMRKNFAPQD
ncbi:TetR/AcrR family transcriptional regulator [Cryptosporangium sp. NPDC051539]|uniref:TetR/AcrR family transcriptional regulator n=1 Tax=Cryptosporangium sp. NPDC051539 TaxID=3363962 RepID=UPI0037AE99C0